MKWQPIETAPVDGTEILVAEDRYVTVARWCGFYWGDGLSLMGSIGPTHWMPLPEPPEE